MTRRRVRHLHQAGNSDFQFRRRERQLDGTWSISADNLFQINSAIAVEQEIAVEAIRTVFAATG